MILCVAPAPSIDKLMTVERLEHGAIHRETQLVTVAGGKSLNAARVVHALGGEVAVVAILAGHAGAWLRDELEREGIATLAVWGEGESRSCLSVWDRRDGRLTEFYERAPAVEPPAWSRFEVTVREGAAATDWVTISGSLPPGVAPAAAATLVGLCRPGSSVALDTSGDALAHGVDARPDLVKVNRAEAAQLLGINADSLDPAVAAAALAERTGAAAIVTDGAAGACCSLSNGPSWKATLDVRAPYPVGSGDAFLAGVVMARENREPWPQALALGLAAAAANAEVMGAGRLDPSRVWELRARASVDELG